MTDLVQLKQQLLAHDFEGTNFTGVLFLSQVHLSITTLANLGENLEVALPQSSASLAEVGTFTTEILCKSIVVLFFGRLRWRRILRFELGETVLAGMYVGEEVVIVVEEVFTAG